MRISDWSSDVCSSDLNQRPRSRRASPGQAASSWPPSEAELLTEVSSHLAGRSDAVAALEQVGHVEQRGAFGQLLAQPGEVHPPRRSEEHTSELQSLMRISYAVFCLKKTTKQYKTKKQ